MKKTVILLLAALLCLTASGEIFDYRFKAESLSVILDKIAEDHPDLNLNFIYNELDNYRSTAIIHTDNPYEALRQAIGLNPVSVIKKNGRYYVEALQHGRFVFRGRAVSADSEPVVAATVMLLSPKDSTVVTYGITDGDGRFAIPCDINGVTGKFSCVGYATVYKKFDSSSVGDVFMPERAITLNNVSVEADNSNLYADKSVYLPTARQKNASQTGTDLLNHMAIPQLSLTSNQVLTNSGKPVALFIDFLPADDSDLQAMRVADVKRVEYIEYPSDPRLQGNPYVINFIMQSYEYGGYVKGLAHTNLISNEVADGLANVRFQYKKMTYDVMGSVYHYDRDHVGSDLTETFRLPQDVGELKEFRRYSELTSSQEIQNWYYVTFKATYNSENVQAQSQIIGRIDQKPDTHQTGSVAYFPQAFPESNYTYQSDELAKYIAYNGNYFFVLPYNNSLAFTPSYSFSHTRQHSAYAESGYDTILNGASDNTNKLSGNLKFKHDFGRYGNLIGVVKGSYEYNHTNYTGSAVALDRARSSRVELAANYDVTLGDLYTHIGFGWDWDRLQFGEMVDSPSSPNFDFSVQYVFRKKHSLSAAFQYESWLPSPSFKSDKIIASSPLLSYTGNPNLVPAKSYDLDFSYTWVPSNRCSLSAYAWAWIVGNRYVFDYEANDKGVLRTIKQPMGTYSQAMYGVSGSLKFLDGSLVFSGNVGHILNHNGRPYNVDHSHLNWHIRARYYLDNWNFTVTYVSPYESADGCMNGRWVHSKSDWYITVGWANDKWNIRGDLINFTRWRWVSGSVEMHSRYYDTHEDFINGSKRAFIQLVAAYTFGFGRKVNNSNEPSVSGSASSGILK